MDSLPRLPWHSEMLHVIWVRDHFGALGGLARKLGVSRQFVNAVFWGQKRSQRVERELVFLVRNAPIERQGRRGRNA